MVYYSKDQITVRDLMIADANAIVDAEIAQGWHVSAQKYLRRLEDASAGRAIALVAECSGRPVGYINVYPNSTGGAFGGKGYPEIVDFGVLEQYRSRGIGTILMGVAEEIAGRYADMVYLGVGLHSGYGSAQRMYIKRGYVPDGSGVWYRDKVCEPYAACQNDDELVLYLSKRLW